MGHSNISVFVPHIGCPHMCAFCNQRTITGTEKIPHADDVKRICTQAMNEVKDVSQTEIAFFGGSFTAVPREYMLELLGAAQEFIGNDKFKGIRISTRPFFRSSSVFFCWDGVQKRLNMSMRTGKSFILWTKVL